MSSLLDAIKAELIVDFIHMHEGAVEMAYRLKGADGLILITDAMRAKGMPYGAYDLGGQTVHVTEAGAHLSNGSLAGSILKWIRLYGICITLRIVRWRSLSKCPALMRRTIEAR